MLNIKLDIGTNKLNKVISPNKLANTKRLIKVNRFKATLIVKSKKKSNKKFITIKTSIYITIIFTKEIIP